MIKANLLRKPRLRRQKDVSRFPGPYVMNTVFRKKFRYQSQASETKDADYITMGSLQNLMAVTSSGTSGAGLFSAVRLRAVEIWADSSATNNLSTIGLDWLSPDAPNKQINATGNSFQPAHIRAVPPKNSAAGRWYAGQLPAQGTPTSIVNSTPYAFSIISNVSGAIIEIDLEFTIFDYDSLNNPFALTLTGGQSNTVPYNAYLDNTSVSLGNGTKNLLIQGVANTFTGYISSW
jgi:hypothetical protein